MEVDDNRSARSIETNIENVNVFNWEVSASLPWWLSLRKKPKGKWVWLDLENGKYCKGNKVFPS